MTEELGRRIAKNRSTLIFVDSRRMAEKITRLVNTARGELVAYAHHGSLSREIRADVESRLKAGELRAIVATSSLEMGIDIGAIDEVVQILPPPSVAAAIQRAGRAGHQVGQTSHTSLYGVHAMHLMEVAVVAREILNHDIEPIVPVVAPLDVLAQIITSMVGLEARDVDEVFAELRASAPYHELTRTQFDLVLEMLAGRYADSRIRDLRARVSFDRTDHTIKARRGALQALYSSGGTIPDRGDFKLRHQHGDALIGSLDEEFVWEAKVGDNFLLGTQSWQIQAITHNDVFVLPAGERGKAPPFWRGEEQSRGYHLSRKIGEFLEQVEERISKREFSAWLREDFCLTAHAAEQLERFLKAQREHTRSALPHRHHVLIEHVARGPKGAAGQQLVMHTLWGGKVNRPYAMALETAWAERFGQRPEIFVGNDAVVLQLAETVDPSVLMSLVRSDNVEHHLRARLEDSGFFGARFREAAGRALLLPKRKFGERLPLWMNRLRSQRLLEAVREYGDFPIVLEAWRSCLRDELDLPALLRVLGELESGGITIGTTSTSSASPMAKTMSWAQVSEYMYRRDEPGAAGRGKPSVREDLLQEVARSDDLRPRIASESCTRLQDKLQRTAPGYLPRDGDELLDWVKDRVVIPLSEWTRLLDRHHGEPELATDDVLTSVAHKLVRLAIPANRATDASTVVVVALESVPQLVSAWFADRIGVCLHSLDGAHEIDLPEVAALGDGDERPIGLLAQILQFYTAIQPETLAQQLGLSSRQVATWLDAIEAADAIVRGQLVRESDDQFVCDARNFETLLRITRAEATPSFTAVASNWLAPFLASMQGLGRPVPPETDPADTLAASIEALVCVPLPGKAWETEVLPARVPGYRADMLDRVLAESDLRFVGAEGQRIGFCYAAELDLWPALAPGDGPWRELFVDPRGRYDLNTLTHGSGRLSSEVLPLLWEGVWSGEVTCDSFAAVRRGLETDFATDATTTMPRAERLRLGSRTRSRRPLAPPGTWQLLTRPDEASDTLEQQERNKDRVRLLLDRYGVLFRQLLLREAPGFRWRDLFRSLRLMELSGELVAGQFFLGIDGLQFMSHRAFRRLVDALPADDVFWINACDPASLCGLNLTSQAPTLPRRVASTHLVYRGPELVLVSRRSARQLELFLEPNDPRMSEYFAIFRHLLGRSQQPHAQLTIETINGEPARHTELVADLRAHFDVSLGMSELMLATRR